MKKYLIKSNILVILIVLIIGTHYSIYAAKLDTNITSDKFVTDMDPNKSKQDGAVATIEKPFIDTIIAVINPLLRVAQIMGGLLMIVSLAMYGINMLLATENFFGDIIKIRPGAQDVMQLKKIAKFLLIGSILLFSSTSIVRIVFRILVF